MSQERYNYTLDPNVDYGFSAQRSRDTNHLPAWDQYRLAKVREIFTTCEDVIDFGGATRGLRGLLAEEVSANVITVDIDENIAPDVVADICDLPFDDEAYDGVLCASMLEHVYNPFAAVSEMHRVMKANGKLFGYVPWLFPYHAGRGF